MSPDVRAFLADSLVAQVATVSPRGRPFMTPLWFVVVGDVLFITTGPDTWAARNVATHPAVTLLFGADRRGRGDRFLRLRGEATRHRGLPGWSVLVRVAAKYYVAPAALAMELRHFAKWGLRARYYAQGGAGYLRVVPTSAEFLRLP